MIFNNKWSLRRHGVQWSVCAKVIIYSIFIDSFTVAVSSLTTMAHFWYGYSPGKDRQKEAAKRLFCCCFWWVCGLIYTKLLLIAVLA